MVHCLLCVIRIFLSLCMVAIWGASKLPMKKREKSLLRNSHTMNKTESVEGIQQACGGVLIRWLTT